MTLHKLALTAIMLSASVSFAQKPILLQPIIGQSSVAVQPDIPAGYTETLDAFSSCVAGATHLGTLPVPAAATRATVLNVPIGANPLAAASTVCIVESYTPAPVVAPATAAPAKAPTQSGVFTATNPTADISGKCGYIYNDCHWGLQIVGGVEQSDLSSQDSQTEGFVDLFTRGPMDTRDYIWLEARFLGAPNNSNTQGIASAVTNPSGTVTASTLSTVGEAIDYVVGLGDRLYTNNSGRWSLDAIAGFGATTPLSSESASVAYVVPAYGTNECNLLSNRFSASRGYNNPLPGSGTITTTTVTGATTTTSSASYCVLQPGASTTSAANGVTTTTTGGTPITDIAFAPENRTSFLLKYVVGLRYTFRTSTDGTGSCGGTGDAVTDNCARTMVDFTLGQDEEITGGKLRNLVYKTTAVFPIPKATGVYFFASASIRGKKNQELAPLLLSQVPISTATGTPVAGSVTVPSPSVFVLPLLQSDRDFYRIGIALNLSQVLPNLFK